ncbi:MAG: rod shape-determining protein MreD [Elusimicrobia bacterium]|nr:rod shape-determining protein MreD [Elusimicrobiota bacterium]
MKRLLFYFISIIIIIFFEIIISKFSLFGIFFIIFIGLYRGTSAGCTVGFFIGLLEGIFSATSFGISSFSYSIIGYFAGRLPKRVDEENIFAQIIVVLLGVSLAKAINIILEMIFIGIRGSFYFGLEFVAIILVPLFFKLFKIWWNVWFKQLDVER